MSGLSFFPSCPTITFEVLLLFEELEAKLLTVAVSERLVKRCKDNLRPILVLSDDD